jgi:hypothetical protein
MAHLGFERKQLGQALPADTNAVSIYSPGVDVETRIHCIVVCNVGGTPAFRIFHDEDGTTYSTATALYYDVALTANETQVLTFGDHDTGGLWMGNSAGNLAVRSSVASEICFTVYGEENPE